jgi:hypothetical protein
MPDPQSYHLLINRGRCSHFSFLPESLNMPTEIDKQPEVQAAQTPQTAVAVALHNDAYAPPQAKAPVKVVINVFGSEAGTTGGDKAAHGQTLDFGTRKDLYGKNQLLKDAAGHFDKTEGLGNFKEHLSQFEARAKKDGVSDEQIKETYKSLDLLLTSDNNRPTNASDRDALAEQMADQLANPEQVRQGGYNTCGAATTEVLTYRHHPEAAVGMVTSIARLGSFDTTDDLTIKVDATPAGESVDHGHTVVYPKFDDRSYASQLFQVGAMDLSMVKGDVTADQKDAKDLRYVEDEFGGGAVYTDAKGINHRDSNYGVTTGEMTSVYTSITGDKNVTAIAHDNRVDASVSGPLPTFRTEAELTDALAAAKAPVVARIDADAAGFDESQPTGHNNKAGRPTFLDDSDRGHFIVIDKYIPAKDGSPAKVDVYNTQGQHNPYGTGGEMSVHDLYIASVPRKDQIAILQNDLKADALVGKKEPAKELELLRLNYEEGKITAVTVRRERGKIEASMSEDERAEYDKHNYLIDEVTKRTGDAIAPKPQVVAKPRVAVLK